MTTKFAHFTAANEARTPTNHREGNSEVVSGSIFRIVVTNFKETNKKVIWHSEKLLKDHENHQRIN
jgi:hypothetical protein